MYLYNMSFNTEAQVMKRCLATHRLLYAVFVSVEKLGMDWGQMSNG